MWILGLKGLNGLAYGPRRNSGLNSSGRRQKYVLYVLSVLG